MQPVTPSSTDVDVTFRVLDSTTFLPYESLSSATPGLALWYQKGATGSVTAITEGDHTNLTDAHSDGKLKHIDDGWYRLSLPDAAVPTAEHGVTTYGGTATGYVILGGALVGKPVEVVSGSLVAASVSGAVGSVTGAVGSVTGAVGSVTGNVGGSVASVAAGGITASSIAADAIGASELAEDAVAEIAAAISVPSASTVATAVWAYATRTLTQSAAAVTAAVSGSTITATRGDTVSASITGLGSITGYTALWFTVKAAPTTEADSASKIQITQAGGLIYLNGAAATAGQGSITVNSAATGAITIVIAAAATAALAAPSAWVYDVQWKDATGLIHTLTRGTFLVTDDVTRAVS